FRWMRALAAVDFILCALTIPVSLAKGGYGTPSFATGYYYAHFGWSLSIGSQIVSYYLMVWFAYDRYLAVCRHQHYHRSQRRETFIYRMAGTIVGIMLLYLPTMLKGGTCCKEFHDNGYCKWWKEKDGYHLDDATHIYKAYAWIREVISRLIPAVLITYFYVMITLRVRELRAVQEDNHGAISTSRRNKERRLQILLMWIVICFYVYNTPVTIYYLVFLDDTLYAENKHMGIHEFGAISNMIQMIGNVSNFVLYFWLNPDFRRTLFELLEKCGCSHRYQFEPTLHNTIAVTQTGLTSREITNRPITEPENDHSDSGFDPEHICDHGKKTNCICRDGGTGQSTSKINTLNNRTK
ncbi:unnamed protein product, partial [Meganyctiphanes norvegica]